jgi:membrane associated rhomboid family serine protease
MGRITETVKHLIIINVILYLIPKFVYPPLQDLFALHFPKNPDFGYWQFVTSMFMHSQSTLMHLGFNMLALWMFGTPLEQLWGRNKFLFFYFSAGLGAGLIYTLVNYYQFTSAFDSLVSTGASSSEIFSLLDITKVYQDSNLQTVNQIYNGSAVGASGAIYGVLVAFGMLFPNTKLMLIFLPIPVAAKYFIPVLILSDLFFGVFSIAGDNIAHFAHLGGALFGFIIMWYWKQNQFKRWDR